ncbi:MAG TPA: SDR family NAD(P)-dependent oxidoreductase [Methylomirabilota bacterium]|nr:SDR family NAD(P)-dependent oxidoreductase [Methylomirabilota bacterium]
MPTRVLVTGGAGFIGSNVSDGFLRAGARVTVFDNFSRPGAQANARWLAASHGRRVRIVRGDIRWPRRRLSELVSEADLVIHNAGQVAVTTSVTNPRDDFAVNAGGTLEVLEAIRTSRRRPALVFSSTNKVYGGLEGVRTRRAGTRHVFKGWPRGIPESFPLDFHSPYGCSKGAGDQYVRDYSRIYGLRTVVFRKSCIYGPRQFGMEDQGWVAWFTLAAVYGRPITIFGDGRQVRDVLYVDDLVRAYRAAYRRIDAAAGEIFNIGGGPASTMSLLELLDMLGELLGRRVPVGYDDWRPGDQKVYVSDIRKAARVLGWRPRTSPEAGVRRLYEWIRTNPRLFRDPGTLRSRAARAAASRGRRSAGTR